MIWQDAVLMVNGFVFVPSLLFAIFGKGRFPIKTSLPTALALTSSVVCYLTLGLYLTSFITSLTALCWYVLAFQVWRELRKRREALALVRDKITTTGVRLG